MNSESKQGHVSIYDMLGDELYQFRKRVMPNEKISKGILNSEAFAFCAFANFLGVEVIIESGVCYGGSTEIWCKYFTKRTMMNVFPVTAVDVDVLAEAIDRLKPYNNVELIGGDSIKILPEIISRITNAKIAVFIDGPKNSRGVELAKQCLAFPQVELVAVHDMCRIFHNNYPCDGRRCMDAWDVSKFYTDDPIFIDDYKFLDGSFADKPIGKYTYNWENSKHGYGPTVGLAWKGTLA